mmetsp:Transcript_26084/g.71842  ORF Transcript_26084/g.71842 Transcript_26084/m.71842 type:complete len:682 (+) Transcript_26084:127-2172(+)
MEPPQPTTQCDDDDDNAQLRERFLDHFPLTESECDVLSAFYHDHNIPPRPQDDENDHTTVPTVWFFSSSASVLSPEGTLPNQHPDDLVAALPLLNGMLQWSMANVFVFTNFGDNDDTNGNNSMMAQDWAIFLEAAVSLLGRRGDSFLQRVVWQAAAAASSSKNHSNGDKTHHMNGTNNSNGTNGSSNHPTPTVAGMVAVLHRLVTLESQLNGREQQQQPPQQQPHSNGNKNDDDSNHNAPSNWMASLRIQVAAAENHHNNHNGNDIDTIIDDDNDDDLRPLTLAVWKAWLAETAPQLTTLVSTLFHTLWWGNPTVTSSSNNYYYRPGQPWQLPRVCVPDDWQSTAPTISMSFVSLLRQPKFAVPLAAMLPQGHDYLFGLYSSWEHGRAFSTLLQALLGHVGPTLLLIGARFGDDQQEAVLGYYTQSPWRPNVGWHGNDSAGSSSSTPSLMDEHNQNDNDAFLFSLSPTWQMFGRTYDQHSGNGLQQLVETKTSSSSSSTVSQQQQQPGLSVGGLYPDQPRLHITESLERCHAMSSDKPFVSGPLLRRDTGNQPLTGLQKMEQDGCIVFDVDWMDVFAVVAPKDNDCDNDDKRMSAKAVFDAGQAEGHKILEFREGRRQKMAYVDKRQFLDVLSDGVTGSNKLYAHREQARGRASFCADDDEKKGYYIDTKRPSPKMSSPKK